MVLDRVYLGMLIMQECAMNAAIALRPSLDTVWQLVRD